MKSVILIAAISIVQLHAAAQGFFQKLNDITEVKKSFENSVVRNKPAIASFTLPAGAKSYYTINGGVALRSMALNTGRIPSKTYFDIFGVYNRNNQINKEQKNFKAGLSIDHKFGFTKPDRTSFRNLMIDLNFTNEYLHNMVDTTHNFLSLLYIKPVFALGKRKAIKFGDLPPNNPKTQVFVPSFNIIPGIEYSKIVDAPAKQIKKPLARLYLASSANFLFKIKKEVGTGTKLLNLIETGVDYTYRRDFYNKTGSKEGYLPLFNYNLSVYPFANEYVSFGATYTNGSDPVAGLAKQEYWLFEFKFKKNLK